MLHEPFCDFHATGTILRFSCYRNHSAIFMLQEPFCDSKNLKLISDPQALLWKVIMSSVIFVCLSGCLSAWKYSALTGGIFTEFGIWVLFVNLLKMFKFHEDLTRITGTLHEDQCTFLIYLWINIKMRNVSGQTCRNNQNTHVVISKFFYWKLCLL